MTNLNPRTITKIEVENFELITACTYSQAVLAQTFDIAYGCDYSDKTTDTECREMKAPYSDVEGFFNAMGMGVEIFSNRDTNEEIENVLSLDEFLTEASFSEQLNFFGLYVKNRLETDQITTIGKGILKAVHSITSAA